MGSSIVHIEGNNLKVDDKEYELTPSLRMLVLYKKPRPQHYTGDDYSVYKAIVTQTRVRAYPNKCTFVIYFIYILFSVGHYKNEK